MEIGTRVIVGSGAFAGEHGAVMLHPVTMRQGPHVMVQLDSGPHAVVSIEDLEEE